MMEKKITSKTTIVVMTISLVIVTINLCVFRWPNELITILGYCAVVVIVLYCLMLNERTIQYQKGYNQGVQDTIDNYWNSESGFPTEYDAKNKEGKK